ncbi:MAG TPA: hypothetical protein VFE55_10100 [Acidimicrobiia bacterium]|nr:hypothetical protein [Acidimicrobiia bacterium]
MRRTAATVLVTLGLLAASLAWWSYAARATILDPGGSARIADVLVKQPVIRDAVAEGLGNALRQMVPDGSPVSAQEMAAVAHKALDDPAALQALRTSLIDAHQRLVGNYDGPVSVDLSPIAAAGRRALLAARPELAGALPEPPPLSVDLPTQHLPKLGWLPERTRELTGLAGLLAATLLALGLLAAADRPRVLARAGRWALRAGVGWAAFAWALPWALTKIDQPTLAALGAICVAAAGPMIAPALALVCAGVGALLGARAWRLAMAALPPAPPPSGPGSGPGSSGTGWPTRPPLPGRRPEPRRGGRRVPVPAGRSDDPFAGGDRLPEGSTRSWWASAPARLQA